MVESPKHTLIEEEAERHVQRVQNGFQDLGLAETMRLAAEKKKHLKGLDQRYTQSDQDKSTTGTTEKFRSRRSILTETPRVTPVAAQKPALFRKKPPAPLRVSPGSVKAYKERYLANCTPTSSSKESNQKGYRSYRRGNRSSRGRRFMAAFLKLLLIFLFAYLAFSLGKIGERCAQKDPNGAILSENSMKCIFSQLRVEANALLVAGQARVVAAGEDFERFLRSDEVKQTKILLLSLWNEARIVTSSSIQSISTLIFGLKLNDCVSSERELPESQVRVVVPYDEKKGNGSLRNLGYRIEKPKSRKRNWRGRRTKDMEELVSSHLIDSVLSLDECNAIVGRTMNIIKGHNESVSTTVSDKFFSEKVYKRIEYALPQNISTGGGEILYEPLGIHERVRLSRYPTWVQFNPRIFENVVPDGSVLAHMLRVIFFLSIGETNASGSGLLQFRGSDGTELAKIRAQAGAALIFSPSLLDEGTLFIEGLDLMIDADVVFWKMIDYDAVSCE